MGNEVESSETPEPEKKEKKSKTLLIIIVILLVLLIGTVAGATALLLSRDDGGNKDNTEAIEASEAEEGKFAYEAGVITSADDAARIAAEEVEPGYMTLEMQTAGYSADGVSFNCYLGNAVDNIYDMYMEIYLDDTGELLYRSGLIPIGGRIESFESEVPLASGNYTATIVFHQIEEDLETEHGNVAVAYDLIVQ